MFANAKETLRKSIVNIKPKNIKRLGKFFGALLYIFALKYRRIVQANLKFAFPEWDEGQVKSCALRVFQNYAMTFFEAVKMAFCRTEEEISAMVDFGDITYEGIHRQLSQTSVINVSAHIGNWEAALQASTAKWHLPTSVVIQKIHNQRVNRWLEWYRSRFGVEIIYKRDAVKAMRRVLKNNRFLILLIDQNRAVGALPINFFGKKTYATPSVAALALRYKVPVYAVYCVRDNNGRLKFRYFRQPFIMERSGDLRADIAHYTQKMQDTLEAIVRMYPDQWFWFHKRWRYHYPELYQKGPVFGKNAPDRFKA